MLKSVSRNATADEISKWNITKSDTLAALMNANDGDWSSAQVQISTWLVFILQKQNIWFCANIFIYLSERTNHYQIPERQQQSDCHWAQSSERTKSLLAQCQRVVKNITWQCAVKKSPITPVFSVTWSVRKHSNMLISCSINISYYQRLKKQSCFGGSHDISQDSSINRKFKRIAFTWNRNLL